MKSILAFAAMFLFLSPCFAGRVLQFSSYAPPLPNNHRPDMTKDQTLVSGYDLLIELNNISDIAQPGSVELLASQSAITVQFEQTTGPTTYQFVAGNYVSYICAGTGGTSNYKTGIGATPIFPDKQTFNIPASGKVTLTVGVIFYKALTAHDNFVSTNGKFVPNIRIGLDKDTGAVSGYAVAINRPFSPTGYTICSGASQIPTSPPLASEWTFAMGTPRELNGGRPF